MNAVTDVVKAPAGAWLDRAIGRELYGESATPCPWSKALFYAVRLLACMEDDAWTDLEIRGLEADGSWRVHVTKPRAGRKPLRVSVDGPTLPLALVRAFLIGRGIQVVPVSPIEAGKIAGAS